ncbi:cytochrome P450 [Streptomyces sp. NPDC101175]|uniref:cytochrome P450 n=1 Tax=Streptomyces sp. NPDC101175 TaxID=3366123 RepID=UPI003833E528
MTGTADASGTTDGDLGLDLDAAIASYPMVRAASCPFDPSPVLRAERQEGPLSRIRLWNGRIAWMVTGYSELRALLTDARLSADVTRPGFPTPVPVTGERTSGFAQMDDPEHARLRRMVQGQFTARRMELRRPAVQRIVDDRIDELLAGPRPADLVTALARPVPSMVICELLGVPYDEHAYFQRLGGLILGRTSSLEERVDAMNSLHAYLADLVDRKAGAPGDDLLSGLVEPVRAGELTHAEAAEMGALLLFAGFETTANQIALSILALLLHPEQLDLLRTADDPQVTAGAVEELLRHISIVQTGILRVALEDIECAGEVIRAGEGVVLAIDIADRDPGAHPGDPDRLDIRRDAHRHVALGHGAHQCLGGPLARLELQITYDTLFRRIPTLSLAVEPHEIAFTTDAVIHGVHELPVTW